MDEREEIKVRLPIEEVVGRYVELQRAGNLFKGLCPFHNEDTPSFTVTPARGTFHCFGCQKHGDIFTFTMETEKLSFPEALKRLADQAGVRLTERSPGKSSLRSRLYEANEATSAFYRDSLRKEQGERARRYLEERHFEPPTWDLFDLGFAPERRDALGQHLHELGFDDRILLSAGLILQDEIGRNARDRFHGRLMFPIRDRSGHITGFGGRTLGDAQPKYLNSPQTEVFDKSSVLYGISRAAEPIRKEGKAILVEGYLDAVRAHAVGKANVVASLGTAVTLPQLAMLSRLTETVIVALDPDPAGQSAAARASLNALAELTRSRGNSSNSAGTVDLRVARLPEGKGDPDELLRDDTEAWDAAIADAVPAFDFYFEQTMACLDRSGDAWRQQAITILLPLIRQFATSIGWQAVWVERLARETDVSVANLEQAVPKTASSGRRRASQGRIFEESVTKTTATGITRDPIEHVEQLLLGLLLTMVVVPAEAASKLQQAHFERPEHRELLEAVLAWRTTENYDYEELSSSLPEHLRDYADELHAASSPLPEQGTFSLNVAYHLASHRKFVNRQQLQQATEVLKDLPDADAEMAFQEVAMLNEERQQIDTELELMSMLTGKVGTGSRRS